jgi:DNA-binding NarL/FixJ family response regulator
MMHAQYNDHRDRKLDSLENVVAGWTPEHLAAESFDTKAAVCKAYSELMYGYERINPDRSMYAARRAYMIGNELGSLYQPYLASKFIGQLYYNKERYDSTICYYNISLGYLERMAAGESGPDNPEGYPQEKIDDAASSLYGKIGNLYYVIDSIDQAMAYYAKAGEIFDKYDWKVSNAILWHNMGEIWAEDGEFDKAIECYNKSIRYGKEADDSLWVASPKLSLGALYMKKGRTTKAIRYLKEADEYYSVHQDLEYNDRIATLDVMGQALRVQKRQSTMLAVSMGILVIVLLVLLFMSRRINRLNKENTGADEAIGEALTEIERRTYTPKSRYEEKIELTEREAEVLPLIAAGMTSKEIAQQICLTEQTIKWRRQRLMAKFDARNTAEMLTKAREMGF